MAIGTLAAIGLGLGALGAGASALSQKSAANKAAQVATDTNATNNALARDIYSQNKGALAPFMQRGNTAGSYLNAMLGLPSNGAATYNMGGEQGQPTQQPNQAMGYDGDMWSGPQAGGQYGMGGNDYRGEITNSRFLPQRFSPTAQGGYGAKAPVAGGVSMDEAQNAFGNYIKNSDYGFQFATGANQVNSGYAGNGTVKSGAAMKGLEDYRQNLQAGYRGDWMNALGNQQGVGLSGANALAGVSTNFGNTIAGNNNAAGNAAANAALVKGNNGIGNVISGIGGNLFGYGTGKRNG